MMGFGRHQKGKAQIIGLGDTNKVTAGHTGYEGYIYNMDLYHPVKSSFSLLRNNIKNICLIGTE